VFASFRSRVALLVAGLFAAGLAASACLTNPPPDLTTPSDLGPVIVHTSLIPAEGTITQWPPDDEFVVPVRNVDPTACQFTMSLLPEACLTCAGAVDAGVLLIPMHVTPESLECGQKIRFDVGSHFLDRPVCTQYDKGDTAEWTYSPPSCAVYDAGAVQDGAFPGDT
jgi:hypothetical protein